MYQQGHKLSRYNMHLVGLDDIHVLFFLPAIPLRVSTVLSVDNKNAGMDIKVVAVYNSNSNLKILYGTT
jgi:hypothetical protein